MDELRNAPSLTVVWDVDDVLNELTVEVLSWKDVSVPQWATRGVSSPDMLVEQLGMSRVDYLATVDEFRQKHYSDLVPNREILEWLTVNGESCHHMALTRTPLAFAEVSAAWVYRHFGRWIRSVAIAPSQRPADPLLMRYESKADVISRLSGHVILVDDNEENFEGIPLSRCKSMLYPSMWNSEKDVATFLSDLSREIGSTHL